MTKRGGTNNSIQLQWKFYPPVIGDFASSILKMLSLITGHNFGTPHVLCVGHFTHDEQFRPGRG